MSLTHFSLCTGIGGIDLAAEWAGFTTIGQCEIDDYASRVLEKNFKGVKNFHDIRTVTATRLRANGVEPENITVLSAGFPCQPYSLAGKGRGDGDERDLWGEVARCIGELKPKWFVGENTPGLFARANQKYFRRILTDLTEMGYNVAWGIWGACDVGAPHKRERVFLCARNSGMYGEQEKQKVSRGENAKLSGVCGKISDPACERLDKSALQRRELAKSRCATNERRIQTCGLQSIGIRGSSFDCFRQIGEEWWQTEPNVGRVADGVSARVDRLRCLGNAVVPQQIYPLFRAIAEYEKGVK